ncbi:hypothetical protein BDV23DRAFT_170950 [Aspergillus alliaceus]|uniref:GPI anchored protein n=1 Tax=Petromyces alliaceus TaxID=209559 RepID=A0A5N7CE71_PETAA|nr:hypothetical protein BDV23DRAFT_170950 [Aspergillus alliaceus]
MKGLQNGIPIAVLAAMASAQGIGGSHGVDIGNDAALGFSNDVYSEVNAFSKDDHSTDIDTNTNITNILTVPPHPPAHGPRESGHAPRGGHEAHGRRYAPTVVGGPHSVDIGNEADLDFMNAFKSDVNSYNEDNHSVKIDKTTHIVNIPPPPPPPFHHGPPHGPPHGDGHGHGRRDRHGKGPVTSVVDGPHTVDVGNAAEFGFKSELKSEVSDYHKDDHSVDIKKTTDIKVLPPPHEPHSHGPPRHDHERRDRHGNGPDTVVGGPHGVDVGNAAGFASKNAFSSDVNSFNEDDHSVDIDKATDIKILSPPHPPHHGPPYGHERGVDVGNANAYDEENSAEFRTTVANIDDHSVGIDETTDIKVLPPPHPPHHGPPHGREGHGGPGKRAYSPDTVVVDGPGGGDVGDANAYGQANSADLKTNVAHSDDHSVKSHSDVHEIIAAPPQDDYHEEEKPHQPQPQHEPQHDPQPQHEPQHQPQPQHEPQHDPQSQHDPQHDPQPQNQPQNQPLPQHETQHDPQPQHEDEHVQQAKTPTPHGHEDEDSSHAAPSQGESPTGVDALHSEGPDSTNPHAPASSQAYGHAQPSGNDGSDFDVPSPTTLAHIAQGSNAHAPAPTLAVHDTPSASNAHMVLTSTLTVAHASSFHKVPVYVPMPSSNGLGAGESHASSTPAAHIPVGVDAEQHTSHAGYSHATPSPSSQGVMFTGGATHFSPSVGVISLFCGVMGLLAYVL